MPSLDARTSATKSSGATVAAAFRVKTSHESTDVILRYTKSDQYAFNPQFTEYSEASTELVASRGGVSIDDRVRDLERGAPHGPIGGPTSTRFRPGRKNEPGTPRKKPLKPARTHHPRIEQRR